MKTRIALFGLGALILSACLPTPPEPPAPPPPPVVPGPAPADVLNAPVNVEPAGVIIPASG